MFLQRFLSCRVKGLEIERQTRNHMWLKYIKVLPCEKHSPYLPHVCHILCHSSLLCCLSFSFVVHSSRILGSTSIMLGALLVLLMCGALSNGKKIKNSLNLNPQETQLALTGASWSRPLYPCPPPERASLVQTSASTGTWTRCVWSDLLSSSIVLSFFITN